MKKHFLKIVVLLQCVSLIGCSSNDQSSNDLHFNEIIKGNIAKITSRNSGTGLLYSITDKKKIDRFVKTMDSTTYTKVKAYEPVTGNSSLKLFNENNVEISSITSNGKGVYHIGEGYYKLNNDIDAKLGSFYKEFYSSENLVNE
ncbi:hypothetical protein [Paenibacillus montanisoli]|uniref:Lipoprotein n=1 Tax=Paenibacillus montanisoli TaxID=2081970 RepID=A0A328UF29_9BACL|nr:hypothetical protein [Paenibacillus montanisoli]RAP78566.1 hypothetical protein DL346_09140 [Paenibacillus montanisoli]